MKSSHRYRYPISDKNAINGNLSKSNGRLDIRKNNVDKIIPVAAGLVLKSYIIAQ
jgi:hypothetical protein